MNAPSRGFSPGKIPACLGCLVACSSGESSVAVTRTDSAGVEIVVSRGPDRALTWTFTPLFRLGGAEEGAESFYRVGRHGVAADTAGRLYILDRQAHRVVVFDSAGRYLRSMGQRGGGPGELDWPFNLSVADDGTVSIYDMGKRAFVRFGWDGSPLEHLRPEIRYTGPFLEVTSAGVFFSSDDYDGTTETNRSGISWWRDDTVTTVTSMPRAPAPQVRFPTCGVSFPAPAVFSPALRWDAAGDGVVANRSAAYAIDVYRGGSQVSSVRRDLPPTPATRELAIAELGEGRQVNFGRGPCTIPPEEWVTQAGFAETVPAIAEILTAPDGSIWVRRTAAGDEPQLTDVFSADGAYIGTLPPGSPFPLAFLPGSRLAARETDDLDVQRLVVYAVEATP